MISVQVRIPSRSFFWIVVSITIHAVCFFSFSLIAVVVAYGSITPTTKAYKIVGIPGSGTQSIPHSYVENFSKWKLSSQQSFKYSMTQSDNKLTKDNYPPNQQKLIVSDSNTVEIRPTIHFLLKGGIPAYSMSGIQMRASSSDTTDDQTPIMLLLLAQQWTTFQMLVEPMMRIVLYVGPGDGTDERLLLLDNNVIREQIEKIGVILSRSNVDDEFASSGFHLISFVLTNEWVKVLSNENNEPELTITCVLTGEADAREVFTLEKDLIEMTAASLLQIRLNDFCENI